MQQGHALEPAEVVRTIDMVRADERPSEVLTTEVLRGVKGRTVRPKSSGQKRYVDAIAEQHHHLRHRPRRHRQVAGWPSPWPCRRCRPRRSSASSSPARRSRRASGSASCPATSWPRSTRTCGRSTTPCYDMVERRGGRAAARAGHRRGGAAGVHARPHAQRQLHHPRRGAEHHARADEDVPHPHRLRLQGRHHRRHHPGRRAGRAQRASSGLERDPDRHRRAGLRAPRLPGRRAPPHRAGHRRRLRASSAAARHRPSRRRPRSGRRPSRVVGRPATTTSLRADEHASTGRRRRWAGAGHRRCSPPRA